MKFDKDGNPIKDEKEIDDPIIEDEDQEEETEDELEIDLDEEEDKSSREEKDRNKAFASMRIENKQLKDSVDKLNQTVSELSNTSAQKTSIKAEDTYSDIPKTDEEWDKLAQTDWKKAVDLRSIQNAQNILKQQQHAEKSESTLTESKQKVLAVHPELNDNNSEKAKIYLSILDQNPDYLTQPRGPLYAMRDMEDYMENTLGYKRGEIRSAEKAGAQREASRQNRIVLNKGAGRSGTETTGNKVVLSKDEMEFCKFQEIDPKEYAKNKQKLSKSHKKDEVSV